MEKLEKPSETDDISCHLQQIGMGTLVCRAVVQKGDGGTNEVTPSICFNCEAGKIYRDIGCDAVTPKIHIYRSLGGESFDVRSLFCKIRKRETTVDYCKSCGLVTAETTRQIVSEARGLFEAQGFYSAYKDIEKAREAIRDGNFENAVTRSISCLESVMKTCHDKMERPLPDKKQVSDLWKSTRTILRFEEAEDSGSVMNLLNALGGVVTHLGSLRNALGDAHGRGAIPPDVSESMAELAINVSATISTAIIRQYIREGAKQ